MKKVEWKTVVVKIQKTEPLAEKEISLNKGERIVAAIATNNELYGLTRLGLYENGNEISAPMSLDFWKRSNSGQYLDGFKPIDYKGGSTLTARLSHIPEPANDGGLNGDDLGGGGMLNAGLAETNPLEVEVVFGIVKEDTSC